MPWPAHYNYADRSGVKNTRLGAAKAKVMLKEGTAQGHPLTAKQKGLFGLIAGGGKPSKKKGYKG